MSAKTIVTDIGKSLIAKAIETGTTVKLKTFAVGDGNGKEYTPTGQETKLVKENWRSNIGSITVNPKNGKEVFVDTPIPEDVGGWWIREYGVFDEAGNLILIGTTNEFYKAKAEEGDVIVVDMNLSLTVQNTSAIQFIIDPAAYVTHQYLKDTDYKINGLIEFDQRPKCQDSVFALKSDIDGLVRYPDIQDDGLGVVTIAKPDGSGAAMRFTNKNTPNIYTEIDGVNGEVRIVGGNLIGYDS